MDSEHRLGLGLGRLGGAYGYIRTLSFVRYLVSSHRSILFASRLLPDRDYSPEDDRVPRCDLFSYVLDRTPRRCDLCAERISRLFSRHGGMYVPHPRDTINQRHLSYERRFTRRYIGRSCRGKSVASLTRYAKVCSPMERIESEAVPCARFVFAGRNARPAALRQLNKFPRRELTYNWHEIIVS